MFKVNEHVLYGLHGVCKIESIEDKKFDDEVHSYYVLRPIFDKGATIFVSTKKENLVAKMIPLISENEVSTLIEELPNSDIYWIENENERKQNFKEIIEGAERKTQLAILKAFVLHRLKLLSAKRKMHTGDEILLKNVEKRIYEEFAFILDCSREEIAHRILSKIEPIL